MAKRKVRRLDDDDDDDLPPPPGVVPYRKSWDNAKTAAEVRAVLAAFDDVPPLDDAVRLTLQKWLYRQDKFFGGGGAGHITMVLRVFESDTNRDALVEPILSAVSFVASPEFAQHGMALLDAIDQIKLTQLLATMRSLDIFSEASIGCYLSTAIRNKVWRILGPIEAKPEKMKRVKLPPKQPTSVTRVPAIVKSIELGIALLALRDAIPCNKQFARDVRKQFPGVDTITASEAMRVARLYGKRPEIYRRLSWIALFELASPKMSPEVRQTFEAKILAGKSVTASAIRKARGPLKGGCLKRKPDQAVRRMAA